MNFCKYLYPLAMTKTSKKSAWALLCVASVGVTLVRAPAQNVTSDSTPQPTQTVSAEQKKSLTEPRDLTLSIIYVADSNPPQWLNMVTERGSRAIMHGRVYNSVGSKAFRDSLKSYPKGTKLSWYASCIQIGKRPTNEEFATLTEYCQSIGLKFVVVPSS